MRKLKIAALVREGLVPPATAKTYDGDNPPEWKMEFDIISTLQAAGHEVRPISLYDNLAPVRECILDWKPHVAFMMLEEFHGVAQYDHAIVSYLELMKQRYTGCNARGLLLSQDKALSKKIMKYHRIPTPRFSVYRRGRKVRPTSRMQYPILVKSATEDASFGISQNSIVTNDEALIERVEFIHNSIGTDALAEEFIEGREFYVGVIGNTRLEAFPVWEMLFNNMPDEVAHIATARVKWNTKYQKKHGIETTAAQGLTPEQTTKIENICKRVYRVLNMSGYGRIDLRMKPDGQVYIIEANANPNLEFGEDFAESAEATGLKFEPLLQRIIRLGMNYNAAWQG